eukprot:9078-Heterococcus_DN1.PRE.2
MNEATSLQHKLKALHADLTVGSHVTRHLFLKLLWPTSVQAGDSYTTLIRALYLLRVQDFSSEHWKPAKKVAVHVLSC